VPDHNQNRWRPSSAAFDDSPDGTPTSVSLEQTLLQNAFAITHPLIGHDGFLLVSVLVGIARHRNLGFQRDPEPWDPSHALMFGNKTESVGRTLAKASEWVVGPTEALPDETR
jgi:hypothetical protein